MTKFVTTKPIAQGDMLIIPIATIPVSAKAAKAEGTHFILAHSETGHHHVIERTKAEVYEAADDSFIAYVKALAPADITHQRSFDTHETVQLAPGNYEIRRQREYMPEGFRKAQD